MKDRQRKILDIVYNSKYENVNSISKILGISKRTLYYDLNAINEEIRKIGELKTVDGQIRFVGDDDKVLELIYTNEIDFDKNYRQNYILLQMLEEKFVNNSEIMSRFEISKNTVANDITDIRRFLENEGIELAYDKKYVFNGKESVIRDLYIRTMMSDDKVLTYSDSKVCKFNRDTDIRLTDYSISLLSRFISFIKTRISNKNFVNYEYSIEEANQFSFFENVKCLLPTNRIEEIIYLTLYISSLPKYSYSEGIDIVNKFVEELIIKFESISSTSINDKDEFKKYILKHLETSFYRIKYKFPGFNPILQDIKINNKHLFNLVKNSIRYSSIDVFAKMRDEEIGFLTMYFGANIGKDNKFSNRIVVVCPNGLATSKTLELQLKNYIPNIEIVDVIPLYKVDSYDGEFDYFVSTVNIPGKSNTIVVKPFLSRNDIIKLTDTLISKSGENKKGIVEEILEVVNKFAKVRDEQSIRRSIERILYENDEENIKPMLKEVLTRNRMKRIKKVSDWKEAIRLSSQILIDEGAIENEYIDEMIASVEEHGPYIVLEEGFALPHATSKNGVNKFSMSLLQLEQAVDFMGKEVKVLVVLATVDNSTHLRALSSLADMLEDEKSLEVFRSGSLEDIEILINREGEND